MKTNYFLLAFYSILISSAAYSQHWTLTGDNIINNNAGGVRIRQDATSAAAVPAHGNWSLFSWGSTSHPSGTASKVWAAYLLSLNHGAGTLTESIGANLTAGNESSGTGTVTNAYGLWTRVQAGLGTVTNGYGVYIFNTAATNDYGIYQAGADDNNFFAGNVGVGTTLTNNPNGYKLGVNGKIGAKEVQVENTSATWADYVFEPDYDLPSLDEVERFIKTNKHLMDIPSAQAVAEHGHKLGEMDVLLLKKVEELTLYVIDLKKEIEQIKKENQALSAVKNKK
jgi:hypothetical protein